MPKLLKTTGVGLLIAGLLLGPGFLFIPKSSVQGLSLAISLLLVAGAFLLWRGRQYAARAAAQTVSSVSRPDVLYLRDFRTDRSTLGQVLSVFRTVAPLLTGLATEEEQLAEALQPLGDLVAIGKPGEELPTPGATRLYASEDEWRSLVSKQMQEARFVVIRAGSGEGVLWELQQAVELVAPQKLMCLVLRMKQDHYRYFRQTASAILGVSLPAPEPYARFGRISGFIIFAADWTPSFLPLKAPFLRRSAWKPLRRMFQFALQPVFEASGVEWKRPSVSPLTVSATIVSVLSVLGFIAALAVLPTEMMANPERRIISWITGVPLESQAARRIVIDIPLIEVPSIEMPSIERKDAYTVASDRLLARLMAFPEMRQLSTAGVAKARATSQELTQKGLRRLDDDRLIRRAALMARISAEADTPTCAAMTRGLVDAYGMEAALRRLSPHELDQWFELIYDSMSAELRQTGQPEAQSPERVQQSVQELLGTLTPADAELLSATLQSPFGGTRDEACRAGRLMYEGVANLSGQSKATLARALVSP